MKHFWHFGCLLSFSLILIGLGGCFLFGVKGIFDKSNYQIVKLEIDNRVILSPQEIASQAKEQIGNVAGNNRNVAYESYTTRQASRIDDINSAFEQLKNRNQGHETADKGTQLTELARITLQSTLNLDRTQDMIYGKAGCNDYTAKFFWQDATKIVVSGTASTRKLCAPKEISDFQNTFVRNLDGIYAVTKLTNRRGYVLNNGRMRIYIK
ncbi:hypothetical protein CQA53_07095 [Helicobacter didelphidarum]|uniref:DUF306 domain-containing protein n=1 Tax=Helicobacter didelphidarum TaxID=2040648 RepID=A0A3D8IIC8_9HELI|nr:META domain-containing protein [Helicobacter didelphidarum]RDU64999.1 hypothetical protein CQA53_07095 [Helicobacter didelphidarum]